jgi:ATP-dependent exoDNAse (exonuclease V) beta subunit
VSAVHDDDAARTSIEFDLDSTLVVVAGAGTGKTTALVNRIIELVRSGRATLREIAAITFTEAAAAELRHRIRAKIEDVSAEHPDEAHLLAARQEVDEAAICTLHAFAQRILVEHSVAAGIPPGFDVLDETAERADFDARFEHFADVLLADPDAEPALVQGFSIGLTRDDLVEMARALHRHWDRLEDGGLERLDHMRAAPGAWPATDPRPVLAAIDVALAMSAWCTDDGDRLREHLATLAAVRAQLASCDDEQSTLQFLDGVKSLRSKWGQQGNWSDHIEEVRDACAAAEEARLELLRASYHAILGELGARLAHFVMAVADERRVEGRLGFHDLLVHARRLLRTDLGAAQSLRRRYRHLLIDEFQDTDPIQVELAARIAATVDGSGDLGHAEKGGLFVVGDPKQSIYRFRRADIELFSQVGRQLGEQIVLVTNFRSVPGILTFVNTVFDELFGVEPPPGQAAHHALIAARDPLPLRHRGGPQGAARAAPKPGAGSAAVQLSLDGLGSGPEEPADAAAATTPRRRAAPGMPPVVVLGGPMKTSIAEVRRAAAHDVALTIDDVHESRWAVLDEEERTTRAACWRDIAVLLPARTALAALEEALEEARIPYRLEGVALLWGSDEVRDVLAVLRAAENPVDAVAVLGALRSPGLACGDDDLVTWHQAEGTWDPRDDAPEGLDTHPVADAMAVLARLHDERWWREPSAMVARAFEELRSFELCLAYHRPRDHWQRLRWLMDQARLFDETVGGSLRSFLAWAELQAEDDRRSGGVGPPDPDDDAVRVMTIHGSKGLEFPIVVLAGLEREVASGQRPPAVLWGEDGTPELRGGGPLRTLRFDQAHKRERELDAREQHRLLYVGMTRARDHLVLCLHHKELKENSSAAPTVAAQLQDICLRFPALWRRLPIAALTSEDDPDAVAPTEAVAKVLAGLGLGPAPAPVPSADDPEMVSWRQAMADFAARRAHALDSTRRAPVTTATAVAHRAGLDAAAAPHGVAAGPHDTGRRAWGSTADPGSPDASGALWRDADTALQIGRAVHSALAAIDLATATDDTGRAPHEVARGRAGAHGVGAHADAIVAMVDAALASPTVAAGAMHRHWRELFVAAPVGAGVLEGFVDLVIEEGDGLVVVDYKTDRTGGRAGLLTSTARYGPQVASYALALEEATGRPVRRCVLVFLGDGDAVEVVLEDGALLDARGRARSAVDELLTSGARSPVLR